MLKNKTRAHAPEPKMATVEKHAPRNYVAFKNIKICQRFQRFRKISKSSKNKKNFKERFKVFRAK